jgi:uncharacterized membrane protein
MPGMASNMPRLLSTVRARHPILELIHNQIQSGLFRVARYIGCHQRCDRSYFFAGRQFPICARCLGLLIGLPLLLVCRINFAAAIACLFPLLLDGGTQVLRLRESVNWLRLFTGVVFSLGVGRLIVIVCVHLWNI